MNPATATAQKNPLAIIVDVLVAPKEAFGAIDVRPRWLVAYLIICGLGIVGALLQVPVETHVSVATITRDIAHDPAYANMSPKQIDDIKNAATGVQHFIWLMYPIITIVALGLTSGILFLASRIGRSDVPFSKLWSLAANVGIINLGIYYALFGLLCWLHAPDTVDSQADMLRLVPSVAWIAPGAGAKLTVLLEALNPFTIWSFVLLALGARSIGKLSAPLAYGTAAVIVFGSLLFAVPLAK